MTSRWTARIIALLILIVFVLMMANLQRRLIELQRARRPAATSTR
ncbi:MAG TPA: hypothetical protein VF980_19070 [Thermoanaerobaculia bacterium]